MQTSHEIVAESFSRIEDFCTLCFDLYDIVRQSVVTSLSSSLIPAQRRLVERVSRCVLEIFVVLCALSGRCLFLAACVWVVCRSALCISPLVRSFLSRGAGELISIHRETLLNEYKRVFEERIGPALFVAFAIDSLFCFIMGICTLNFYYICRALMVSMPITYLMYIQQKNSCGG